MKNLITVFLLFVYSLEFQCQWSTDPNANNPICVTSNDQFLPRLISDGIKGAMIVWEDFRNGSNYDVYAQRVSSAGVNLWSLNGVAISAVSNDQTMPEIAEDGQGGAIIVWNDFRGGNYSDIYTQKINTNGTIQWTANGVSVCSAVNNQKNPNLISDGFGGAIITWEDKRDGALDIYAQKIDANGTALWSTDGVMVCNAIINQDNPTIASDGLGGAIIIWADNRNGTFLTNDYDIYAQRINANGDVQWAANGLSVCSLTGNQVYPNIINNNTDEVIITWHDARNGIDADIYIQRLRNDGTVFWTNNGVALCTTSGPQSFPNLVNDGAGGAIVTWQDYRTGAFDVYAQRINVNGDVMWTTDGVPISTEVNAQISPDIISDGQGGAIITWCDYRNNSNQNIYAQLIKSNGIVQWILDGLPISTADPSQYTPSITSDGGGGAIIVWWDYRNGSTSDIYAQQVSHDGQLGVVTDVENNIPYLPQSFLLEQNYPNPFNNSTVIRYSIPQQRQVTLKVYSIIGEEVAVLVNENKDAGNYEVIFETKKLTSGIYLYTLTSEDYVETRKMVLLK